MTRVTATTLAVLLAGSGLFAQMGSQTTAPTTPPPTQTPAGAAAASQAPAPKSAPAPLPFPDGAVVGYVHFQAVILTSKYGKCGSDLLKAMHDKDAAALAPIQKQLTDLNTKIQAQQGIVSEDALTQLTRQRDKLLLSAQSMQQQFQTDEQDKNQDLLNDFQNKVVPLTNVLRKEKNLSFILTADVNGAIAAANPALDLTTELVKRMDATYPDCVKK